MVGSTRPKGGGVQRGLENAWLEVIRCGPRGFGPSGEAPEDKYQSPLFPFALKSKAEKKTQEYRDDFAASKDTIKTMAKNATQVAICLRGEGSPGSGRECFISKPKTFPIEMMKQGFLISHKNGDPCNQKCVDETWVKSGEGTKLDIGALWSDINKKVEESAVFYHAAGSEAGLWISFDDTKQNFSCRFNKGASLPFQIYIK